MVNVKNDIDSFFYADPPSSAPKSSSTNKNTNIQLAGIAAQLIGQLGSAVITGLFAKGDAKLAAQTQVKITEAQSKTRLLTDEQNQLIIERAQLVRSENEKLKLLNDVFAAIATAQLESTAYNPNESYVAALTMPAQADEGMGQKNTGITTPLLLLVAAIVIVAGIIEYKKLNQ